MIRRLNERPTLPLGLHRDGRTGYQEDAPELLTRCEEDDVVDLTLRSFLKSRVGHQVNLEHHYPHLRESSDLGKFIARIDDLASVFKHLLL